MYDFLSKLGLLQVTSSGSKKTYKIKNTDTNLNLIVTVEKGRVSIKGTLKGFSIECEDLTEQEAKNRLTI